MYVKWADAHGTGGVWDAMENAVPSRIVAQTVGWMTGQSKTEVTLIQTAAINKDDEDAYFNSLTIPKGMILEMHEIPGHEL